MPGVVTPARRRRDASEEEEDFDVSIDGESPASKRARLGGNDDEDDSEEDAGNEVIEEQSVDGGETQAPLLPDSFRRSPRAQRRSVNGFEAPHGPNTHQPGSIVRVTMTNFVTYTNAEFKPGPSLNMVIGPNGTGKSTLVCALCIGLGWPAKHLGRAKDLQEFIKHGSKTATIEIELAADPKRHKQNPVITTKLKQGGDSTVEFLINGKKENKTRVRALAQSFSIQVDNLCQFLPQDKVVEFAALSSIDLLVETQRAAAPEHMSVWHEQLKAWRKTQKVKQKEQQALLEVIKAQQKRQDSQQGDVIRIRERDALVLRRAALKKMKPFAEYKTAKEEHTQAAERKKQAQKEFARLERRIQPNLVAVKDKDRYVKEVEKATTLRKNLITRNEKEVTKWKTEMEAADARLQECENEIEAETKGIKAVRQRMPALQRAVSDIQRAIDAPPPEFDPAAANESSRQKVREMREAKDKIQNLQDQVGSLGTQIGQREQIIANAEQEKGHLQSQAGQQANKLRGFSRDTATAWDWIQQNRDRFESDVFGPPLVECSLKDRRHARAVESVLQQADLLAFTATSKADFSRLSDQFQRMGLRDINLRSVMQPVENFQPPVSLDVLHQHGLEHWILDLLEGPSPVLAMLCDNRSIHATAFTSRELSTAQFSALQKSSISSWVDPKQSFFVIRRREYGDKATSTRVNELKQPRFFTDAPVDQQRERDIDRRITETQSEVDELRQSKQEKQAEVKTVMKEQARLKEENEAILNEKNSKQRAASEYQALPTKLEKAQRQFNEAKEKSVGFMERKMEISRKGDGISLEKGQFALNYANAVEALRGLYIQLFEAEVMHIEAKSDLDQLNAQNEGEQRMLRERQAEVKQLDDRKAELLAFATRLRDHCRQIGEDFTDQEQEVYDEVSAYTMDQLTTEIVSVEATLDSLQGTGDGNTLREFDRRAKEIEEKTAQFQELQANLAGLEEQITDIKERWEPELDELVGEISEAFAENFSKIQCAGEVGVYKDEDFENWSIQIKVKFRENEPLSILDSHRQSGGERAVSTIFYLMALQSLARAPFRVVDEINQGMDPRNERLVHSRMVDIACAEVSEGKRGSQYFLITPKLLQGLRYHPEMKVHCIASGEYMPDDFREVDFGRAAKRALELRGGHGGGFGVAAA